MNRVIQGSLICLGLLAAASSSWSAVNTPIAGPAAQDLQTRPATIVEVDARIAALEATAAGSDAAQLEIVALKQQIEIERLEALAEQCLADGRSEEAALARIELQRLSTVDRASTHQATPPLTYSEKQALQTGGSARPVVTQDPRIPSTIEGGAE